MYEFHISKTGDLDAVIQQVSDALKQEGFGILTDIDVAATLKNKLGEEMRPYRILGACNPALAHQALSREPNIGLLLPCNVVVREEADKTCWIGFMDPVAVLGLVDNEAIRPLAGEVRSRLRQVAEKLQDQTDIEIHHH